MSVRVALPPGCEGFSGGGHGGYRSQESRAGGTITVSDETARKIERQYGGDGGLVQARQRVFLGTASGMVCTACQPRRVWNAWNTTCNRCGAPTEPEPAPRMPS